MVVVTEEIFGPIAAVQTFTNENEVINKANATDYGLAAYFFDVGRVMRVAEALGTALFVLTPAYFQRKLHRSGAGSNQELALKEEQRYRRLS